MLKKFKKILSPPVFKEDEEKTRVAQYLNAILNASIILIILLILSNVFSLPTKIVLSIITVSFIGIRFLMTSGKIKLSSYLFISITWLAMTYLAWTGNGIHDTALIAYVLIFFLASLLDSAQTSALLTALSIISLVLLSYAEKNGLLVPIDEGITAATFSLSAIFILIEIAIYFTVKNLSQNLADLKKNENSLIARNKELLILQNKAEKHISEIEKISTDVKNRAARLETIAKVSQTIALNQNLDTLLPEITQRISEDFNFYHVGIFFISLDGKFAQLQATNSPGGKKMLKRKHQLEVGQVGLVGRTADDGQAHIALDVGQDAAYFNNPDLPETRSEMALPLKFRNEIIGVLDVQSKEKSAFTQEDTDTFNILANQIAIAIENALQVEKTKTALEEAHAISRQYIQQAWTQLSTTRSQKGYRYTNKHISPLTLAEEDTHTSEDNEDILSIPVQIRDETIGFIEIKKDPSMQTLTSEDVDLAQAIANRAALALENARLLEDTSRRASRERTVSEITTKIRSHNAPQAMIETALKELKKVLGVSNVKIINEKLT